MKTVMVVTVRHSATLSVIRTIYTYIIELLLLFVGYFKVRSLTTVCIPMNGRMILKTKLKMIGKEASVV
jgi:hypothetical protein